MKLYLGCGHNYMEGWVNGSLVAAAITTIISFISSSLMLTYIINYKYKNIKFSYLKIITILIFAMNPFLIILVERL